ncbi:D-glycerate dehydrogenase [Amaricoccus sp.]|uniref:2-hydroxyacid dehydrogenase n=1 Tax=Amaricoccus sp. TaxID=1872485 RepID=UPI001B7A5EEA|nr:D-glycerate dehydrogenase [Amaricoccus sp.]MBP7001037.1 D-glycerate dehydrogenase [Amaricoccus sp.]
MADNRLKVVVTRRLPDMVEARMRELFDATLSADDRPMAPEAIAEAIAEADVLVPTITDRIDQALISRAGPKLKLIANYGAGFDHIDVATALRRGIMVTNTPGVLAEDTADMAMALILAVPRRLQEGAQLMQRGDWDGWSPTALLGHRIAGKKLGILGFGAIGRAIAARSHPFGLEVHYHARRRVHPDIEKEHGATWWESLDQMLTRIDILSINVPHTPSTFHLMNARRLKLMKPTAIVVNTARGEVIDENALTRMLRAGELAGAGLDVYEHGHDINPRLRALPNVLLLPHMGSATIEGRIEMGEKVIINIKTYADGHRPPDQVVPAML